MEIVQVAQLPAVDTSNPSWKLGEVSGLIDPANLTVWERVFRRLPLPEVLFDQEPFEMPVYTGPIAWQGKYNLCRVYALVNGLLAMGEPVTKEMVEEWTRLAEEKGNGDLISLANNLKCLPASLQPKAALEVFTEEAMDICSGYASLIRGNEDSFINQVRKNASDIQELLISPPKHVLLFGVMVTRYASNMEEVGRHVFAVDGFRLQKDATRDGSRMEVHVIDSAFGEHWIGIEYLTYALQDEAEFKQGYFMHPVVVIKNR